MMGRCRLGMGRTALAVGLGALLVAGACGSTVDEEALGTVDDLELGAGFGGPVDGPGDGTNAGGGTGRSTGRARSRTSGLGSGAGPGSSGSTPEAGTGTTLPSSGGTTGRKPVGPNVPGVSDHVLQVGMMTIDQDAAETVAGGVTGGEQEYADFTYQDVGEAVAAHVNANGGIAGRRLKIVWYQVNAAQLTHAEGRRQESQRACATFTEDNQVFAFVGPLIGLSDIFYDCAKAAGAVTVPVPGGLAVDDVLRAELGDLWFNPTKMVADRRNRNLVESLVRRGVLQRGTKVALLYEDRAPTRRSVEGTMQAALQAHGVEVVAKAAYPDALQSPWDTYVVQFRDAEATHVLYGPTWDGLGLPVMLMMTAAETQGWRPTWGLASDNQPSAAAANGAPEEQFPKTFSMGVEPPSDTRTFADSETRARCHDIARRHDIGSTASFEAELDVMYVCDPLLFLWAALQDAGEVSPAGVAGAVGAFGERYRSPFTVEGRTRFAPGRHDGPVLQRDVVHDTRCTDEGLHCWRYDGAPRALG